MNKTKKMSIFTKKELSLENEEAIRGFIELEPLNPEELNKLSQKIALNSKILEDRSTNEKIELPNFVSWLGRMRNFFFRDERILELENKVNSLAVDIEVLKTRKAENGLNEKIEYLNSLREKRWEETYKATGKTRDEILEAIFLKAKVQFTNIK